MAIVRTSEFLLRQNVDAPLLRLERVLNQLEIDVRTITENAITASAARAIRKNRWASDISIELLNGADMSSLRISIDMMGTKHYEVMEELLDPIQDLIDDRGLADAVKRLGKAASIFAKLELRMLPSLLRGRERVLSIASGSHDRKLCAICLTTERILFVDKGLLSTQLSVSELLISSIVGISTKRSRTGEAIEITASGSTFEVERVMHGQAEELSRKIREVQALQKEAPSSSKNISRPETTTAIDIQNRLEAIELLRSQKLITETEFKTKRQEILDRI